VGCLAGASLQSYLEHWASSVCHIESSGERCSDACVGNALYNHSTIAESDHTYASHDTRFARHSQVASQGTGAVNVHNADMAMY
jgi:hypothetical protein